jgi:hypothetical protein
MVCLNPRTRRRCRWALVGLVIGASAAGALKVAIPASPPTLLSQVIPTPTGNNGYEELVAAADALRASKRIAAIEAGGASLEAKRALLREPTVMQALDLVRRGLAKPVVSPRATLSSATLFPELPKFRRLARLLTIQQYVLLADGRAADAIATARLGWRLGTAIQTDTLLSGVVGTAILAITTRGLAGHLDQLSERDCDLLYQACLERLREPDPSLRMLEAERNAGKILVGEIREGKVDPASILGAESRAEPRDEEAARAHQAVADLKRLKRASAEEYAAQLSRVETALDQWYDRALAEWQKPAWQRSTPALPEGDDLAARLATAIAPASMLSQAGFKYAQVQAETRLLALHAAIRRYRWEHDRLPASLDDLLRHAGGREAIANRGELSLDLFTGQPLKYEVRGARFRLTSAGPPAAADDPNAVEGHRPVSIVPGEEPGILRTR